MSEKIYSDRLFVFRNLKYQKLFDDMCWLINYCEEENIDSDDIPKEQNLDYKISLLYKSVNALLEMANTYGFEGNLFHTFLTFNLANNENAFTTSAEVTGAPDGTINQVVMEDFRVFKKLMEYDITRIDKALGMNGIAMIIDYKNGGRTGKVFNKRVRDKICELAKTLENSKDMAEFYSHMTDFYKVYGVGKYGLNKAFRLVCNEGEETKIIPVTSIDHVYLDDLIGYELQKKKLIENTKAFVEGKKANNVLLYGDAGTGKSSSIKAILNEYYDQGLRMIEVYKHQFSRLNDVIEMVKDRNYKFIIYMDDLSFEEFEIEYKYLKAVIEGGLAKKPGNVLIYATSNRRHLVRETYKDKQDRAEDMHTSDTVQEKLSLAARFGVSIYYGAPDKKQFHNIVEELAKKNNITIDEDKLYQEANAWELSHGGFSGRTATQFINHLLGVTD